MISNELLVADVNIVNIDTCQIKYNKLDVTLENGMMCAGQEDGKTDACQVIN